MKRNFKTYAICWAILLALFNVICFVTPSLIRVPGVVFTKFDGAFWAGYAYITIAFFGQLGCAYFAFKEENLQKFFYNLPLITVSYSGLVLTILFGGLCMAIPNLPNWTGIVVCLLILAFNMIAVMKASAAAEIITGVDEKVKAQTQFIKLTTVSAQNIMNRAKTEAAKTACEKVYEALRYSDPMSVPALSVEEAKITVKLDELATAVSSDTDNISDIAEEVVLLVKERNNKCKALR